MHVVYDIYLLFYENVSTNFFLQNLSHHCVCVRLLFTFEGGGAMGNTLPKSTILLVNFEVLWLSLVLYDDDNNNIIINLHLSCFFFVFCEESVCVCKYYWSRLDATFKLHCVNVDKHFNFSLRLVLWPKDVSWFFFLPGTHRSHTIRGFCVKMYDMSVAIMFRFHTSLEFSLFFYYSCKLQFVFLSANPIRSCWLKISMSTTIKNFRP